MQDVTIIGGGISALTAAHLLKEKGLAVTVLEKNAHSGGPIQTVRENGYLAERGPNSLLLPDGWTETFIENLGLQGQLLHSSPAASKRYIVKDGHPTAVPTSPLQAITTPLFSLKAKLGFLGEPFRKQISKTDAETETVASFVRRRMGSEFLDYAIDPFVSGVYAGDPNELVLQHAFPLMRSFERDGKSIIRGAFKLKKQRKADGGAYKKRSISFMHGLQTLPQTLAKKLGEHLHLNTRIRSIEYRDGAWNTRYSHGSKTLEARSKKLFVCIPSYAIKTLPWPNEIATRLAKSPDLAYPSVHSLSLGFRLDQIEHALDGFGMLVPSKEDNTILGALFSSSLYPNRAPDQHCLITVMIGGRRRPDFASKTESELTAIALENLRSLVGLKGKPTWSSLSSWTRAIPQYTAAFAAWKNTLYSLQNDNKGLHFGGHAIDGIAMGACIQSGRRLSEV